MTKQKQSLRKKDIVGLIILVIAWIGLIGGLVVHHEDMKSVEQQNVSEQYSARMSHTDYMAKKQSVMQKFNKDAMSSKSPTVRSIAKNAYYNLLVSNTFNKFFTVYDTWNNHTDYVSRARKLRSIATPHLLSNKYYFDDDKDSSGQSIVDAEQSKSEFNACNTYITSIQGSQATVLADTKADYWTSGSNAATGETWYKMNYDTKSNKITNMQKIYHNPNVTQYKI